MKRTRRTAAVISTVFLLSAGGVTLAAPAQAANTALAYAALSQVQEAPAPPDPMVLEVPVLDDPPELELPPTLPLPEPIDPLFPEIPELPFPEAPPELELPPTLPLPEPTDPTPPEIPDVPELPGVPEIPEVPEVPEVPEIPAPVPTEPPAGESLICSLLPSLGLGDPADAVVSAVFDC